MKTASLRQAVYIALSILVLCGLGWSVHGKEELIRTGETVLLELAPVDPRSLMQGDYMRLDYKVAQEIAKLDQSGDDSSRTLKHGHAVIATGADGVAGYARLYDGKTPTGVEEKLLRFHRDSWQVRVVPNSFMFQEGHRQYYDKARYGVFKFDREGNSVLVGLAGEDKAIISPPVTAPAVLP